MSGYPKWVPMWHDLSLLCEMFLLYECFVTICFVVVVYLVVVVVMVVAVAVFANVGCRSCCLWLVMA